MPRKNKRAIVQTLRGMSMACNGVADLLVEGNTDAAVFLFKASVLDGYLKWLRTQYKEWKA